MSTDFNPLYSPYGAYELKASYQRNMLLSMFIVTGSVIVATILGIIFINPSVTKVLPRVIPDIEISKSLPPPPTVAPVSPQMQIHPPKIELPKFTQLAAVDDNSFIETEFETEIVTIDNLIEGEGIGTDPPANGNFVIDGRGNDEELDGLTTFKIVDQRPEFIYKAKPEYPRIARLAGIEGTVWIAVEVDIDGSVSDAKIYKTSESDVLDRAALSVAYDNKFRPAIKNKKPLKIWISYEVEFILTN